MEKDNYSIRQKNRDIYLLYQNGKLVFEGPLKDVVLYAKKLKTQEDYQRKEMFQISPQKNFCINCGRPLTGNVCVSCLNRTQDEPLPCETKKSNKKSLRKIVIIPLIVFVLLVGIVALVSINFNSNSIIKEDINNLGGKTVSDITPEQTKIEADTPEEIPLETDKTTGLPLIVSFIDVGQGDSILIQSPNGKNMLIDAGGSTTQTYVYNYLKGKDIKKIDVLVATHPHADHIGGMEYIIDNFDIGLIYMPKATTSTKTYEDLLIKIKSKGLSINTAKAGVTIDLDKDITIKMIAPIGVSYDYLNDYSAVIKIIYKNNSFLFIGDAQNASEQEMLNSGADLKSDVLKVGHHGSSASTSINFLNAVSPKFAVISVGKENSYGHPAQSTLDKLNTYGVSVYRTDESGTIVITSDGQNLTTNASVSSYNPQVTPQNTVINNNTVVPSQNTVTNNTVPNDKDIIVYKTKTGKKYHRADCKYLKDSSIPITLAEAKAQGLTPCEVCHPPE
jgi:competence protein ComEC